MIVFCIYMYPIPICVCLLLFLGPFLLCPLFRSLIVALSLSTAAIHSICNTWIFALSHMYVYVLLSFAFIIFCTYMREMTNNKILWMLLTIHHTPIHDVVHNDTGRYAGRGACATFYISSVCCFYYFNLNHVLYNCTIVQ